MNASVDAAITLPFDTPPELLHAVEELLTIEVAKRGGRKSRGPRTVRISHLRRESGGWRVPRGMVAPLRMAADELGVPLTFTDLRAGAPLAHSLGAPSLRDYQALAVDKLRARTQGVVVLPAGGGKTRLALGAIAQLATPTIILVGAVDLAEQWRAQVRELLGVEAGLVGDGKADFGREVTVALVQALWRRDPEELRRELGRYGLCVVDEAHHVAARAFRDIVDLCPAKYRLGLTATPTREDGLTPLLGFYLGETLLDVRHEDLIARGWLTPPQIRRVTTTFTYAYETADDYAPMMEALVHDEERLALIVGTVVNDTASTPGLSLVLSGRVEHCAKLADALGAAGLRVGVLTGRLSREARAETLAAALAGALDVLVATTVADEGLDLPLLQRVYLTYPARARGRTEQRLGRVMRPHPGKRDTALVDFVDGAVPLLRRQGAIRHQLYRDVLGIANA